MFFDVRKELFYFLAKSSARKTQIALKICGLLISDLHHLCFLFERD